MNPYRILVVEDESIVAMDIQDRLSRMGYDLAGTAATGERALALIEKQRPDLVLMDIRLQGDMDGIAVAQEVHRRFRIPTIFLTAYSEDATLERAKLAEPSGFILKPYDDRELKSTIEIALYKHAAVEEIRRLNRLYELLSQVNQFIVRVSSREELFPEICRLVVTCGRIDLAWIAWLDPVTLQIAPIAHFGEADRTLAGLEIPGEDRPIGCGNPGLAVTTGQPFISNDCGDGAAGDAPPAAREFGFKACASFPLRFQGRVCGALNLCVNEAGYFRQREIELLEEVAMDISFALDKIEGEQRRRQAESALAESQVRLELALTASQMGVFEWDIAANTIYWSPRCVEIFGTREDVGTRESFRSLVHPEDAGWTRQAVDHSLVERMLLEIEFRIVRPDGQIRWLEKVARADYDDRGHPRRMIGTVRDITGRKQADEELHKSETRLRLATEAAQMGIWERDLKTNRLHWSAAQERLLGFEPGTFPGTNEAFLELLHPDSAAAHAAAQAQVRGEAHLFHEELHFRLRDGSERWGLLRGQMLRDDRGEPDRIVGVQFDVTERKLAENAVRESEERYRSLVEESPDAIGIYQDGKLAFINSTGVRLLGARTKDELLGRSSEQVIHPEDHAAALDRLRRRLEGETGLYPAEARYLRLDGTVVPVEVTASPITFGGKPCVQFIARDVTERKRAKESLVASEVRYRRLFESAKDGILILDAGTGMIVDVNPYLTQLLGLSHEAMVGLQVWDLGFFRDIFANQAHFVELQRQEYVRYDDKPLETADGRRIDVEFVSNVYRVNGSKVIQCNIRDITERKRAQAELQEREERLRLAMEAANMGSWDRDLTTNALRWSETEERLMGYAPGTFPGTDEAFTELIHPDSLAVFQAAQQRVRTGDGVYQAELRFRCKDGRERWGLLCGKKILDDAGRAVRIVGVDMDITGRKQAEAAMRESEEQFRSMFELASIGMAQTDSSTGMWLRVNEKMCQITGYSVDEMLRLHISEITHPDDRQQDWEAYQAVVRGEAPDYRMEKRYVRKDGTVAWMNVNMTVLRDAAGQPARTLATVEDITERKRLEEERWNMEILMRQQQKLEAIGTLAGGVAHEINNPINGIMNYAQLIQDRLETGSPLAEYTGEILHETQRVATIVRNLLTFSRDERQSHSPARMVDIVESTLSLIRTVMRHDQIHLQVDVPVDLPNLKCRSQQLQQVLMNLMTNARDALNERYPGHDPDKVLSVGARLFEKADGHWIRVTVEDHGAGITPEVRERMFDPFFTTKPRDKGTGLGLAISHGIVKEHHGELTVESEPGRFTRMHLDLPVDNGLNV